MERQAQGTFDVILTPTAEPPVNAAIERMTISSFILQHSGTLNRGSQELSVRVVPDSGTDELEGLSGTMIFARADAGICISLTTHSTIAQRRWFFDECELVHHSRGLVA